MTAEIPADLLAGLNKVIPADREGFLNNLQQSFDNAKQTLNRWIDKHPFENIDQSEGVAEAYVKVSKRFWTDAHAVEAAIALLLDGSDRFARLQKGTQIPRGTFFNELFAIHYHILNDLGAATWWALHTQADQALLGRTHDVGRNMLQTTLGVSQKAVDTLSGIANKRKNDIDWSNRESFAEEIVRDFVISYPEYGYILGQPSLRVEFPLSEPYYEILLDEFVTAESEGKNQKELKESFERLASYLFMLIPGCVPRKNVKDENQTHETDIVVRNLNPNGNLIAEVFGRYFVAECKNWKVEKVGSPEVGYFLQKMKLMHAKFGVLFARNGITGDKNNKEEETAARQLIRRSFHEDKTLCVVLGLTELQRLGNRSDTTFRAMLFELSEEFRFGRP